MSHVCTQPVYTLVVVDLDNDLDLFNFPFWCTHGLCKRSWVQCSLKSQFGVVMFMWQHETCGTAHVIKDCFRCSQKLLCLCAIAALLSPPRLNGSAGV